jgi:RNA-directed DNA polymerase
MAKGDSEFAAKGLEGQENTDAPWPTPEQAEARVLGIQTKLHHWATDNPARRFDDLFNLVHDPAFLLVAWRRSRGTRARAPRAWTGGPPCTSAVCEARQRSSPTCGPS